MIGIDIGGTKIAAYSCNRAYQTLAEVVLPCPAQQGGEAVMQTVIRCCEQLQQQTDGTLAAIGVGTAGQINPEAGTVVDANDNFTDWIGTPIKEILQREFEVPAFVDNDVRTMALAEATHGAGIGYQHVLCITVGTGIGGAIILHGDLWHGAYFSAGEIGYLYAGKNLTIEDMASGVGMEKKYDSNRAYPLQVIAQRAEKGELKARQTVQEGAMLLAEVLAPISAFLGPQALIVGGGVPQIGRLWWDHFRKTLENYPLKSVQQIDILPAQLGNRAGMIGASILAWQGLNT